LIVIQAIKPPFYLSLIHSLLAYWCGLVDLRIGQYRCNPL
jgi:hypothetical protein